VAQSYSVTVQVLVENCLPIVAVMVHLPTPTAVIRPLAETVATFVSLEDQVTWSVVLSGA
jgi:hypothetical protein